MGLKSILDFQFFVVFLVVCSLKHNIRYIEAGFISASFFVFWFCMCD